MTRVAALIVAVLIAVLIYPSRGSANADGSWPPWWVNSDESLIISELNAERSWYGFPRLIVDPRLTDSARAQVQVMKACRCIEHQSLSPLLDQGWNPAGENVASAGSAWGAHVALSYSPHHLANILGPRYKGVGVGTGWIDGRIYVSEVFGGF